MKKIMVIVVVIGMALCLTGCVKSEEDINESKPKSPASTTAEIHQEDEVIESIVEDIPKETKASEVWISDEYLAEIEFNSQKNVFAN